MIKHILKIALIFGGLVLSSCGDNMDNGNGNMTSPTTLVWDDPDSVWDTAEWE